MQGRECGRRVDETDRLDGMGGQGILCNRPAVAFEDPNPTKTRGGSRTLVFVGLEFVDSLRESTPRHRGGRVDETDRLDGMGGQGILCNRAAVAFEAPNPTKTRGGSRPPLAFRGAGVCGFAPRIAATAPCRTGQTGQTCVGPVGRMDRGRVRERGHVRPVSDLSDRWTGTRSGRGTGQTCVGPVGQMGSGTVRGRDGSEAGYGFYAFDGGDFLEEGGQGGAVGDSYGELAVE